MATDRQVARRAGQRLDQLGQESEEFKLVQTLKMQGRSKSDVARQLGRSITWVTRRWVVR